MMNNKTILVALLVFLSCLSTSAQTRFTGCATGSERVAAIDANLEKEILVLVNIERKKYGLDALTWSDELAHAARYHAADMAIDNYFEHDSQDPKLRGGFVQVCGTFERIKKFYKSGFACAENISAGSTNATDIVQGWMDSPGHKQNILNASAKYMGAGFYSKSGSQWGTYAVQCFGY